MITAGQQVRAQITFEANLTNCDATIGPHPYVKYSHEPPRARDVPAALARAIHHAALPPRGPAFVSIPMDDWNADADGERSSQARSRAVTGRSAPDPQALTALATRLASARAPVLVAGPDIDAAGAWQAAVALAEKQRLPVWASPATGGSRLGFPENHPHFVGVLPPAIGPISETLKEHDLVLVVGSSVFLSLLPAYPRGAGGRGQLADRNQQRSWGAGAGPMGDAIAGDVALALERLVELVPEAERSAPEPRSAPGEPARADPLSGSEAMASLADAWPDDAIAVVETPSSTLSLRNRLRISRPGSYYFCASGGLGFGISAAVGVQLARPDRPVVCVLGEGSAQYGITAPWSAMAYRVPVTFLALRNDEYMILKWFAMLEQVAGAPALDLPGLDVAAVANTYGMPAHEVTGRDELTEALCAAIAVQDGPRLVQVPVATGMWLE